MRIISINMNGIRSAAKKGFFTWLGKQNADIVCAQEIRVQANQLTEEMLAPAGLHSEWFHAEKPGYSGTAIFSRLPPDKVVRGGWEHADCEGRIIAADFGRLTAVSLYLPSGSSGDERQQRKMNFLDHLSEYLARLQNSGRHVVVCGDWNISHTEKDLKNWRSNRKNSGFLPEEREWMDTIFAEGGGNGKWCDVFRHLHPHAESECYTWWSNRGRAYDNNVGWRLDYQVATRKLAETAVSSFVFKDLRFSDHAPLVVDYQMPFPS
ncbi:MAG: exodeoxyribonuclease III [Planctomycetota bacterium]|nr:MAG: exodeoxyribonuclease III [Planctomycetota bacterium]